MSLVSKPHSTPYLCLGCAGGHRGTREGSLHLIHLGVSTPSTEGASGTFVGQREQISSPHQPGVRGCAPAKLHSCLQMGLQLGQRKPWALGTPHVDPHQAAGCPLARPPAPSADTWTSPLAGRVGTDNNSLKENHRVLVLVLPQALFLCVRESVEGGSPSSPFPLPLPVLFFPQRLIYV